MEEKDVDDLYRNALTELQEIFDPDAGPTKGADEAIRASFFRFVDVGGAVLSPGDQPAGEVDPQALAQTLAPVGHEPGNDDEQSIAFIAINRGNDPSVLRQIVLTKIPGWDGNELGALVLGFVVGQTQLAGGQTDEIKGGIWLNHQFYIAGLSASDRHLVAQRVQSKLTDAGGNFVVDLENGPHLLFYKALRSKIATAYDVCL